MQESAKDSVNGRESHGGWSRRRVIGTAAIAGVLGAAGYKLSGSGGSVLEGRSRAKPVVTSAAPPQHADVVIIGGGDIGVATAFFLAKRGVSVVVCEKGAIAGEASGRSVGQVASAGLDPVKLDLLELSKRLWGGMNEEVQGETGYRSNGYTALLRDESEQKFWEEWLRSTGGRERAARILSARETNTLLGYEGRWHGAYHNPTDGCAEPTLAASAFATAAAKMGAVLVAPCAVRGFGTQAGRVAYVVTEKGTIRAGNLVLAGGCWSSLFAGNANVRLPALNVFSMCRSVRGVNGPDGTGDAPSSTWRKQIDGGYTISVIGGLIPIVPAMFRFGMQFREALFKAPWDVHLNLGGDFFQELRVPGRWKLDEKSPFERLRILQPTVNRSISRQAIHDLSRDVPAFKSMQLGELWSGALVTTPDNMPTLSSVQNVPGLYLATGFTYGLTMMPAAGQLMAELITGARPSIDLRPYRYERYIDSSTLRFTA